MKLIRYTITDIKRNIINVRFVILIFSVTVICLMTTIYIDEKGQSYTAIEAMFTIDRAVMLSDNSFSSYTVFTRGLSGRYSAMFFCVITAVSSVSTLIDERKSGYLRFVMMREDVLRFSASKLISAMISGGLLILAGNILYGMIVYAGFPGISEYSIEGISWLSGNLKVKAALYLVRTFVYGAFSVLPAMLLSAFMRSKYLNICLPYMLSFIHLTAINKLYPINGEKPGRLYKILEQFQLSSISDVVTDHTAKKLILCTALILFVFLIFTAGLKRRCDYAQ